MSQRGHEGRTLRQYLFISIRVDRKLRRIKKWIMRSWVTWRDSIFQCLELNLVFKKWVCSAYDHCMIKDDHVLYFHLDFKPWRNLILQNSFLGRSIPVYSHLSLGFPKMRRPGSMAFSLLLMRPPCFLFFPFPFFTFPFFTLCLSYLCFLWGPFCLILISFDFNFHFMNLISH